MPIATSLPVSILVLAAESPFSIGIGTAGFVISIVAIYLATTHAREIRRVQAAIHQTQAKTETNLEETIKIGRNTLDALHLNEVLVTDEHLAKSVKGLAADFADVIAFNDPLLTHRAKGDVKRANNYVHMAAEGHVTIGPEALAADLEIPSALLAITQPGDHFWASSVVSSQFWARASAYLQQQRDRIKAQVDIHRVFIFQTADLFDDHAQKQIDRQVDAGIKVHSIVEPQYTAQDIVAIARPGKSSEPGKSADDVLYAAEFRVDSEGRVTGIDIWSATAGHRDRVTELWNSLRGFYDGSTKHEPASDTNPPAVPENS